MPGEGLGYKDFAAYSAARFERLGGCQRRGEGCKLEMPIPDFQSLMLPILRCLDQHRWATADLVDAMAEEHKLSIDERRSLLPSGRQTTIANRTHWAIAYLNKAGLITRVARGQYEASARGHDVLSTPPERITINYLQRFPEFAAFRPPAPESEEPNQVSPFTKNSGMNPVATPEERLEAADRELKAELAATLLNRVRDLSPNAFEQLIVDLLVKIGYGGSRREAAERLGRSGDGGIDGVIREDALGLDAVYIQAKRYSEDNSVGAPDIRGFAGSLLGNGATKGVFVTTSRFSAQAREASAAYKTHRIVLIDGAELAHLMIEYGVGVRTVQTIRLQRLDLEPYEEAESV
jgi:restriction system protein